VRKEIKVQVSGLPTGRQAQQKLKRYLAAGKKYFFK
jgi:hypothetical protein